MKFLTFDSRDAWMQARQDTVGASTLSHFINDGTPPTPLPNNVPALQDALTFGSVWEPEIVLQYARLNGLHIAGKNIPIDELEPTFITWHDNSFYLSDDYPAMHVSYDAIFRDKDGHLVVVEVKTGSAGAFWNVRLRSTYQLQASIEATFIGAMKAVIVYAQRPPQWKGLTSQQISTHLADTLSLNWVGPYPPEQLREWLTKWNNIPPAVEDGEGNRLLAELLEAKQLVEERTSKLYVWLTQHPDAVLKMDGRIARLKETSTTRTDYAKYFNEHPTDLTSYQKTTTTTRLSITKEH